MSLSFDISGFHALYSIIAVIMWAGAALFSLEYLLKTEAHDLQPNRRRLYYISMFITFLATVFIFLSRDLYTLFIFFEVMSLTSYVWVAFERDKESLRAASTYLAVAVIGGLVMLMGIFMLYDLAGTLDIDGLREYCAPLMKYAVSERAFRGREGAAFLGEVGNRYRDMFAAGLCLLFGFGAKAGAFPLHIWLPKAHPVAPAPLSALLSGILTKTGIFGCFILCCSIFVADDLWGCIVLIIGLLTMLVGAVLAIFSINIKRTLACSSVSQIGFILTGLGIYCLLGREGNLAVSGALLHAVNHSLFKLVLFIAAGAVFMNTHSLNLNDIRGFGRNKTVLKAVFASGALGIAGVPLFSGYISKTLIHEAILEYYEGLSSGEMVSYILSPASVKHVEWIFIISGACTVAYMLKLFISVFVEKNSDEERQRKYDAMAGSYMTGLSKWVLILPAVLFPLFGSFPGVFMNRIALWCSGLLNTEPLSVNYFSAENLKGGLISIIIGLVIYFFVIRGLLMDVKKGEKVFLGDMVMETEISEASYIDKVRPGGGFEYVNCWPEKLDLEELVYRPLLLKVLPAVFGFVCRVLDSIVDFIVVALRKTVFKDSEIPCELSEGNGFTLFLGNAADLMETVLNHTVHRRNPREHVDHPHAFAMKYEELMENEFIILRSMSFGLILFCLGLMVTVIYLLFK